MASSKPETFIRKTAASLPGVEEGTVCDKVAFKAGKKNFLFMGSDGNGYDVKLKLKDSLEEANELAASQAGAVSVGSTGWVELSFPHDKSLPQPVLVRWIRESYRLLVPKKISSMLDVD